MMERSNYGEWMMPPGHDLVLLPLGLWGIQGYNRKWEKFPVV
jgi:hypothetical protein